MEMIGIGWEFFVDIHVGVTDGENVSLRIMKQNESNRFVTRFWCFSERQ